MSFDDDMADLNDSEQESFGSAITHYSQQAESLHQLSGIIDTNIDREETDQRIYLGLSCTASDFTNAPVKGDEITTSDSRIYKIVAIDAVELGLLRMKLRFDRELE